jgi:hypothetical protein
MDGRIRRVMCTALLLQLLAGGAVFGFGTGKSGFTVKFMDLVLPYRVMAVFVLPGEVISLEADEPRGEGACILEAPAGTVTSLGIDRWKWKAPQEEGLYPIRVVQMVSGDSVRLHAFVMIPFDHLEGEYLNGYRIGKYPTLPLKNLSIYRPPRGFVEVSEGTENVLVSPHFSLGQFMCKEDGGYPKYLVLKTVLLLKLELILEKMNERGYPCETFSVMSGYRTPYYNRMIGTGMGKSITGMPMSCTTSSIRCMENRGTRSLPADWQDTGRLNPTDRSSTST